MLPKLTRIALFSATELNEVVEAIAATGRTFKKVYVMTDPGIMMIYTDGFDNVEMTVYDEDFWEDEALSMENGEFVY